MIIIRKNCLDRSVSNPSTSGLKEASTWASDAFLSSSPPCRPRLGLRRLSSACLRASYRHLYITCQDTRLRLRPWMCLGKSTLPILSQLSPELSKSYLHDESAGAIGTPCDTNRIRHDVYKNQLHKSSRSLRFHIVLDKHPCTWRASCLKMV